MQISHLEGWHSIFRHGFEDVGDFGEAADALVAASEIALGRVDEMDAVIFELSEVALGGWVKPHFAVHGGGDESERLFGKSEVDGGKRVGCEAVGELGESVGAGGGDEEEVGAVGEFDVTRFPRIFFVLKRNEDGVARENLQGEWRDELGRVLGHDAVDGVAEFGELAGEFSRFVGCDGAGDAQNDGFLTHEILAGVSGALEMVIGLSDTSI